jgi:hypothetical protein
MNNLKQLLLEAPVDEIDPTVRATINEWSDVPTAIQILKTLDFAVYGGGASEFCMNVFNTMLAASLTTEGIDYETVVAGAVWRDHQYK